MSSVADAEFTLRFYTIFLPIFQAIPEHARIHLSIWPLQNPSGMHKQKTIQIKECFR